MHLLFLHGPGLNTEAERRALAPALARSGFVAGFWNEPSALRPKGPAFRPDAAFAAALEDLALRVRACPGPVTLVSTSSGAVAAARLAADPGLRVAGIVLVSPVLDVVPSHRAILELARADFARSAPEKARRLGELLALAREPYDAHFQEGLGLAGEDPDLLSHYFVSEAAFRQWAAVAAEPEWGVDLAAFHAAQAELARSRVPPSPARCRAVFGDRDPVARPEWCRASLDRAFPGWRCHVVPGAGHWPHLEDPEGFLRILASPE